MAFGQDCCTCVGCPYAQCVHLLVPLRFLQVGEEVSTGKATSSGVPIATAAIATPFRGRTAGGRWQRGRRLETAIGALTVTGGRAGG